MVRRNRFFALACVGLLAACGGGGNTSDAGDSSTTNDSATDAQTQPGQTYSYVISQLKLDSRTDPQTNMEILDTLASNPHTGFNVDGRFSDQNDVEGCLVPDFYSKFDSDQHMPSGCSMADGTCKGGVDNQLLQVADALSVAVGDINQLAKENIDQSKLVILIRVLDVNDFTNDSSVTVKLYLGYPDFNTGCNALAANRPYKISTGSLNTGSTNIEDARFSFTGSIINGRLQVSRDGRFDLPLPPIMGQTINLSLNNTKLRLNATAAAGLQGNLGGWVKGLDIRSAVAALAPGQTQLVDQLLPSFLDVVDPSNTTSTPMQQCGPNVNSAMPATWGGISLGFGVETLPAMISTTPAAEAGAGVCGNQTGSDN